jgi:hypothetical protein
VELPFLKLPHARGFLIKGMTLMEEPMEWGLAATYDLLHETQDLLDRLHDSVRTAQSVVDTSRHRIADSRTLLERVEIEQQDQPPWLVEWLESRRTLTATG